jgi:hypothetical protein
VRTAAGHPLLRDGEQLTPRFHGRHDDHPGGKRRIDRDHLAGAIPLPISLKVVGDVTLKPVPTFLSTDLMPAIDPLPLLGGTILPGGAAPPRPR